MFQSESRGRGRIGVVGCFLLLGVSGLFAEELSYRDLARRSAGPASDAPLIPLAARRSPGLSRAGSFQVPAETSREDGLIPLALSQGSEAARIFQRNQRRVSLISGLFQRMKDSVRAQQEEQERRRSEAQEAARSRAAQAIQKVREEEEAARREAEARRSLEVESPPPVAAARPAAHPESTPAPRAGRTGEGTYVVQPGDSLIVIAREVYGDPTAWKQIQEANDLDERALIRPGDELVIPPLDQRSRPRSWRKRVAMQAPSEPVLDYSKYEFRLYNIQAGDTLSGIAAKFYGSPAEYQLIEKYNAKVLSRGLRAGDKLTIPLAHSDEREARYRRSREGLFD